MNKRAHRGSGFRNFLSEQAVLAEVETRALKQGVSLRLGRKIETELMPPQATARRYTLPA
jgi:hypothetical protein